MHVNTCIATIFASEKALKIVGIFGLSLIIVDFNCYIPDLKIY